MKEQKLGNFFCVGGRLGLVFGLSLILCVILLYSIAKASFPQGRDALHQRLEIALSPISASDSQVTPTGIYGGEFRYGLLSEPTTFDPISNTVVRAINSQIFEGLLAFDADGNLVPAIAESYETVDAQTFTFTLRTDVYFHNGRRLVAQDVIYSWERYSDAQAIISSITALDANKLVVTLNSPYIQWLYELPVGYIVGYAIVPSETLATIDTHPIGTGPFKFEQAVSGKALTLTANNDYYAGRPYLDAVVFTFYSNVDQMYAAFQAGELDLSQVPRSNIESLKNDPNFLLQRGDSSQDGVWFNVTVTPTNQSLVRQALKYAINVSEVVSAINAAGPDYYCLQQNSLVPAGFREYNPVLSSTHVYSPAKALELLYAAGYTDTFPGDGILDDGQGNDLTIEIDTNQGNLARSVALQSVAEAWRDIGGTGVGLSVTEVLTPWNDFLGRVFSLQFPAHIMGFTGFGNEPYGFLSFFRSDFTWNSLAVGYNNAQVDDWLEQSKSIISTTLRYALYQKIENQIWNDTPIIPMWSRAGAFIKTSQYRGMHIDWGSVSNEIVYLKNVYLSQVDSVVAPESPITLNYTHTHGGEIEIQVPQGAVTETTKLVYSPVETLTTSAGWAFAGQTFELNAYRNDQVLQGFAFETPISVTLYYLESDLGGLDENSLDVRYWTGSEWSTEGIVVIERNSEQNYVIFSISHLSQFSLFGKYGVYIPLVLKDKQ